MPFTTLIFFVFFFNDTATTEIYTLSLHDALPICRTQRRLPCHSAFRIPHSALQWSHDRPPLSRRQALGPRVDLGEDRALRREDPAHRARARAIAPIP